LGLASEEEVLEVEAMAATHVEIRDAIDEFSESLEQSALANAVVPDATVKAFIMATINYTQRLENGEEPTFPPPLNEASNIGDYSNWLSRADMVLPNDFNDSIHARIIGYTPEALTAIIWIKDFAPGEVHHNEYEKFLIVEGSCNIAIEDDVYEMTPGDYMEIPLHKRHRVTITSDIPCKVILQRAAA
jgi:mannose-6-phosphate isomerase-like protein (cupin superfamily)